MTRRQDEPCAECSAPDGTSCVWDCAARFIPDAVTATQFESSPTVSTAGPCDCLVCQSLDNSSPAGLEYRAGYVIARGLTVEASRLYWTLERNNA